jgi:hypothetical protein
MQGRQGLVRGGNRGSSIVWDGAEGGTLFDLIGINGSEFKNLEFSGGFKSKVLVWLRQGVNGTQQLVGSSGVNFHSCTFSSPGNVADGMLVAAGRKDHPTDTYQTSEIRFFNCFFQGAHFGPNTILPWAFRALDGGNTKNFVFSHCTFTMVHRGVEAYSGYVFINECNVTNIGGYGRPGGCAFYGGGNTWTILGGGIENGDTGFAARFIEVGQLTKVNMLGVYLAATPPADDYIVRAGGGLVLTSCDFESNGRVASVMVPWTPNTVTVLDQEIRNSDSSGAYKCITPGTTASSGGPTGTGSDIIDGTVHWKYVGPANSNVLKIQATATELTQMFGAVVIENCSFRYNSTAITAVPLYDGSDNNIAGATARVVQGIGDAGDYARLVAHKARGFGNNTGKKDENVNVPLPDFYGDRPSSLLNQALVNGTRPEITIIRNSDDIMVLRVPHTAFLAESGGDGVGHPNFVRRTLLLEVPQKSVILDIVADTTVAWTGPSGSVTMKAGFYGVTGIYDPIRLLKEHDIKVIGTKGLDDNDFGTGLARATRVGVGCKGRWTSSDYIYLDVNAPGGIANLTSGVTIFYVTFKRLA